MQNDATLRLPAPRPGSNVGRALSGLAGWAAALPGLRVVARMDDRGATLVEFGFVAPMLFLLMASIIDLGIMLTTQSLLDGAARDAARLVRTGQVQTASSPITSFQNQLCSSMGPVMTVSSCQAKLIFDVETFANFGAVTFPACTLNANQTGSGTVCNFSAGTASQIVGIQVTYNYSFIVPWVGSCLTGGSCWTGSGTTVGALGSNTVSLISTVVLKNEPFPS